jgi:hypothetical protein
MKLGKISCLFWWWNIPMGRRQNLKPRWRAMGFTPKKFFGYAPKYALSIWGASVKKIVKLKTFFFKFWNFPNSGNFQRSFIYAQSIPKVFHKRGSFAYP